MTYKNKICPNCGEQPPRTEDDVLCKECFDTSPFGEAATLQMEGAFRTIMGVFEAKADIDRTYNRKSH